MGRATGFYHFDTNVATSGNWAGKFRDGVNSHPLPILYHELVHAHQDLVGGVTDRWSLGTSMFHGHRGGVPNIERQAVGLTWMDESGLQQPGSLLFSENMFRREIGMPERTAYETERGNPMLFRPDRSAPEDEQ